MSGQVFQTQRRVEFRDTDAAGIVHFSVFFAYMEAAEHEFLRHLGLSVVNHTASRTISWPRVAAKCDYRKSIRFEQIIDIDVWVQRLGTKSVTYAMRVHADSTPVADGEITAVCCEIPQGDMRAPMKPVPIEIPTEFRNLLQPYVSV
jgi:4-hydroxybenzoyl-CoA thioesterase/acyl-CoA thioester hydrolase